jgi:hypothetical protein
VKPSNRRQKLELPRTPEKQKRRRTESNKQHRKRRR